MGLFGYKSHGRGANMANALQKLLGEREPTADVLSGFLANLHNERADLFAQYDALQARRPEPLIDGDLSALSDLDNEAAQILRKLDVLEARRALVQGELIALRRTVGADPVKFRLHDLADILRSPADRIGDYLQHLHGAGLLALGEGGTGPIAPIEAVALALVMAESPEPEHAPRVLSFLRMGYQQCVGCIVDEATGATQTVPMDGPSEPAPFGAHLGRMLAAKANGAGLFHIESVTVCLDSLLGLRGWIEARDLGADVGSGRYLRVALHFSGPVHRALADNRGSVNTVNATRIEAPAWSAVVDLLRANGGEA